jgi:hypothetical protein
MAIIHLRSNEEAYTVFSQVIDKTRQGYACYTTREGGFGCRLYISFPQGKSSGISPFQVVYLGVIWGEVSIG